MNSWARSSSAPTKDRRDSSERTTAPGAPGGVLEAARSLLLEGGSPRLTIAGLAKAAAVSPQTIYNSIGNEAAVIKTVYDVTLALLVVLLAEPDYDVQALATTIDGERHRGNSVTVRYLAERFGLPPGMSAERATDILWALTAPESYDRLVRQRGWTAAAYEQWLGDAMVAALADSSPSS